MDTKPANLTMLQRRRLKKVLIIEAMMFPKTLYVSPTTGEYYMRYTDGRFMWIEWWDFIALFREWLRG